MFDYVLPGSTAPPGAWRATTKPEGPGQDDRGGGHDDKPGKDKPPPSPRDPGQIQTQMIGEKPGDDLGYDPSIIPTEKIPD